MVKRPDTQAAKLDLIRQVGRKVEGIVARSTQVAKENEKLVKQNEKLRNDNQTLREQLEQERHRIAILELREGFSGTTGDRKKAEARVNRLLREIDKCIALVKSI